jgi:hypothetical protein
MELLVCFSDVFQCFRMIFCIWKQSLFFAWKADWGLAMHQLQKLSHSKFIYYSLIYIKLIYIFILSV